MSLNKTVPVITGATVTRVPVTSDLKTVNVNAGRPELTIAQYLLSHTDDDLPPVLGEGQRFLQSAAARLGKQQPISALFLGSVSDNAIRFNTDLFNSRHEGPHQLCESCAGLSLYCSSQFVPPIGPGYYPGRLSASTLFFAHNDNYKDFTAINRDPDHDYLTQPVQWWFDDPVDTAECDICHQIQPVIRTVWRKAGPAVDLSRITRWQALSATGRRHKIETGHGLVDVVMPVLSPEYTLPDTLQSPDQTFIYSSWAMDKAKVTGYFSGMFNRQWHCDYPFYKSLYQVAVHVLWAASHGVHEKPDYQSGLAMEARQQYFEGRFAPMPLLNYVEQRAVNVYRSNNDVLKLWKMLYAMCLRVNSGLQPTIREQEAVDAAA